jgi:hypothetical protein
VPHVYMLMYVMMLEFAAASQLEKVDMLDSAEFIAIDLSRLTREIQRCARPPACSQWASPVQTCPVGAGFSDQAEQLLALLDGRHLSAPSSSAWKFFCNTSNAATSASALSLLQRELRRKDKALPASREAGTAGVQKSSRHCASWCSKTPRSRHQPARAEPPNA